MTLTFTDKLPARFSSIPVVISGEDSLELPGRMYLIGEQNEEKTHAFEIRYEVDFSSFQQLMIIDDVLAAGHQEHLYLFNLTSNTNILRLEMNGYFGHLYSDHNLFYVADAGGLYCINKAASILWHNSYLGIDGVIVNDFSEDKIAGSGEWDPPGGWRDFILNKQTGKLIE